MKNGFLHLVVLAFVFGPEAGNVSPNGADDHNAAQRYWRPEFSTRTGTPEKRNALEKLFSEYNTLTKRTKQLNDEIYSRKLEGERLKQLEAEREKNILRLKVLEKEAMLWRQ